jgi:hypothetical protein
MVRIRPSSSGESLMSSTYLDRPLLPLAVVLR